MKKKNTLNRIIKKYRIKNTIYDLLFLLFVLLVAFINDKLLEFITFLLTYSIIRNEFTKAIHGNDFTKSASKGIIYCRYITTIIQLISIMFLIKIDITKYFNILLAVCLGIINFFAKDYLEHKIKKQIFYKGMSAEALPKDLVGIEYDVMFQYYVQRDSITKIAFNLHYSYDNIYKIKHKVLKRYS